MIYQFNSRFLSLALLTCTILNMSCRQEDRRDLIIDKSERGGSSTNKYGYLKLSVNKVNEVTLRSTEAENPKTKINHLMFFFYNHQGTSLEDIKELTLNPDEQLEQVVIKTKPNNYQLVVLANPSDKVRNLIRVGSSLSLLNEGVELKNSDLSNHAQLSMMGNQQGAILINRERFSPTLTEAQNALDITLEPSLARIIVYGNPRLRAGTKANLPIKYDINNLPKKVSILRRLNKLSTGQEERQGDASPLEQRYAKSPLWEIWSQNIPNNTSDIASLTEEKLRATNMKHSLHNTLDLARTNTSIYVKESTLPDNCFLQGLAPYIHIAYPYVPQGLTLNNNEGWISYKGKYYTETQVKELLAREQDPDPLHQALKQNNITIQSFDNAFSIGGINFYHQSYSYYSIFIKHFSREQSQSYGRYGIVRNNEYHIHLTAIHNPGSPTPLNYINDLTPITEQQNTSYNIHINNSTSREQNEEL